MLRWSVTCRLHGGYYAQVLTLDSKSMKCVPDGKHMCRVVRRAGLILMLCEYTTFMVVSVSENKLGPYGWAKAKSNYGT